MRAIPFKESNQDIAKDQDEYKALPVHHKNDSTDTQVQTNFLAAQRIPDRYGFFERV